MAVDADRAAEHAWVAAQLLPPVAVRENGRVVFSLYGLRLRKRAPHHRAEPQGGEEVRGDPRDRYLLRRARFAHDRHAVAVDRQPREGGDVPPALVVVRQRAAVVGDAGLGIGVVHAHQPVGGGEGERPEQHRVDDGEDGQVGADAERQGGESGDREARRLAHQADGIAQVLMELVEQAQTARLAAVRLGVVEAAEFQPRTARRLRLRHAGAARDRPCTARYGSASPRPWRPRTEAGGGESGARRRDVPTCHTSSGTVFRAAAIADARRFQSAVSSCRRRRPASVRV